MNIKTVRKNKGLPLLKVVFDFCFIELGLEIILGQNLYHVGLFCRL